MYRRFGLVLLVLLAACGGGPTTSGDVAYQVDEPVTALNIDARAAGVDIVAGDGPVTVTEKYRYAEGRPS